MSYIIVHSISIQNGNIYVNEQAQSELTKRYQEDGLHAVLKFLGEKIFKKEAFMRPHNCRLTENLKQAGNLIQQPLSLFLDADHAGEFIAAVTEHLQKDTVFSPVEELRKLESLRSDPKVTLDICKNNPRAFNFAEECVRRNRDSAKRYVDQCALDDYFIFPSYFVDDKDFALAALKINGQLFHQLGKSLRNDKDAALLAYNSAYPRVYSAFDPTHIGKDLLKDKDFLCELCCICPNLSADRLPSILNDPDVAETWIIYNQWSFINMELLPPEVLKYQKVREALFSLAAGDPGRCAKVGMLLHQAQPKIESTPATSLDELVSDVVSRKKEQTKAAKGKTSAKSGKRKNRVSETMAERS